MTIVDKIKSEYPSMTKLEREISAFLLSNIGEFSTASLKELSSKNKMSTTTIIRFAKKLGFDGFKDFQKALRLSSSVQPNLMNKFEGIAYRSNDSLLSDTINNGFTCVEDTFSQLTKETIKNAIDLISKARRVYTFGMKESYALAHYAYTRFYTVRSNVSLLDITNGDVEQLLDLQKDDVCIVFLFHRYTKRALDILSTLSKIGIQIILVTNSPFNNIEKYATVIIPCVVYGVGIKNTSIAPICVLDYLCNVLAINNSKNTLERFKKIEMILENQSTLGS